jgi:hypothetical protein
MTYLKAAAAAAAADDDDGGGGEWKLRSLSLCSLF